MIDSAWFNVPLNTLQVISGTSFYGSNDPTNSVKALKEVMALKDQASIPPGPSHHVTIIQHIINTKYILSTVQWAQ